MWRWSVREVLLCVYIDVQQDLSKLTDCASDFKCAIQGGGQYRELDYHYNGIEQPIVWDPNKAIDIGQWTIGGGGWLERFWCISIYMHTKAYCTSIYTATPL